MVSNSLSLRRDLLARPIVCKKGPPPIPPEPPPTVTCWIHPETYEAAMGEPVLLNLYAFDSDYGPMQPVAAIYTATGGLFTGPDPITNDVEASGEWLAPFMPGSYQLKAVFTWPDSTICISIVDYTVSGMPPP